jgi:hypothetical protein
LNGDRIEESSEPTKRLDTDEEVFDDGEDDIFDENKFEDNQDVLVKSLNQIFSTLTCEKIYKATAINNNMVSTSTSRVLDGLACISSLLFVKSLYETNQESIFMTQLYSKLEEFFIESIEKFTSDQVAWIIQQKGDPKKGIGIPILKTPSLLAHIISIIGNQVRSINILHIMF